MLMTPVPEILNSTICKPKTAETTTDDSDGAAFTPSTINPGMMMFKMMTGVLEDAVGLYGPIALVPGMLWFLPAPPPPRRP